MLALKNLAIFFKLTPKLLSFRSNTNPKMDETNLSSLPRSSIPPLGVVVPDTILSNPQKAERWVLYRNPQAQERADPSDNKREDEPSAVSPASDTNETTDSRRRGLLETVKHTYSRRKETKQQKRRPYSKSTNPKVAKRQCHRNSSRRAPTICDKESSDEEKGSHVYDDDNSANNCERGGVFQAAWEEKFQLLVQYKNEYGTARVLISDPLLGCWVQHQRTAYKQNKLPKYRRERLDSIGFEWNGFDSIYRANDAIWMEMYNQLLCYKRQHNGSTNVPYRFAENKELGRWVHTQRRLYSKEKLSPKRIDLLESIGFKWNSITKLPWMEMYNQLLCYKRQHNGSTTVPRGSIEYKKLANWVAGQRHQYSKKKLSQKKIERLESIGFVWDLLHKQWMDMYQRLVAFTMKYGTTCVPFYWNRDPKLARWVNEQRQKCKDQLRIDLLNRIGFVWSADFLLEGPRIMVSKTNDQEEKELVGYVVFERGDNRASVRVTTYPMGSPLLQKLMDPVKLAIESNEELHHCINDIRFETTLADDALVTITYNRSIGDEWRVVADKVAKELKETIIRSDKTITLEGRSRKIE